MSHWRCFMLFRKLRPSPPHTCRQNDWVTDASCCRWGLGTVLKNILLRESCTSVGTCCKARPGTTWGRSSAQRTEIERQNAEERSSWLSSPELDNNLELSINSRFSPLNSPFLSLVPWAVQNLFGFHCISLNSTSIGLEICTLKLFNFWKWI